MDLSEDEDANIEYDPIDIETACPNHDPGGYWFSLDDLNRKPDEWLNHLRGKRGPAHKMLVEWITKRIGHDANLGKLYDDEPYKVKWERPA